MLKKLYLILDGFYLSWDCTFTPMVQALHNSLAVLQRREGEAVECSSLSRWTFYFIVAYAVKFNKGLLGPKIMF